MSHRVELVALFRARAALVRAASAHKTSQAAVAAPDRVTAVLANVRDAATQAGLDGDAIAACYATIVKMFVGFEAAAFAAKHDDAGAGSVPSLPEIRARIDALDREIVQTVARGGDAPGARLLAAARAALTPA